MVKAMRRAVLAAAMTGAAAAPAQAPSPAVTWAGCAGALVAKTMLAEDQSVAPRLGALARRALAEAKAVPNPEKLTPSQIEGVAMASGKIYLANAKRDPEQRAKLDKLADDCTGLLAKLPG